MIFDDYAEKLAEANITFLDRVESIKDELRRYEITIDIARRAWKQAYKEYLTTVEPLRIARSETLWPILMSAKP